MSKLREIGGTSRALTEVDRTPGKPVFKFYISGDLLNKIWKTNRPPIDAGWYTKKRFSDRDTYLVIKNRKGEYWCEWSSSIIIWASRWYEMPKAAGKRAEKLIYFVEQL